MVLYSFRLSLYRYVVVYVVRVHHDFVTYCILLESVQILDTYARLLYFLEFRLALMYSICYLSNFEHLEINIGFFTVPALKMNVAFGSNVGDTPTFTYGSWHGPGIMQFFSWWDQVCVW